MTKNKLVVLLLTVLLVFSFTSVTLAKKVTETKAKVSTISKDVNITSAADRASAKVSFAKQRGLTRQQVINNSSKRISLLSQKEMTPIIADDVPGAGDINPLISNYFNSQAEFDEFMNLDVSVPGYGSDWFWFEGSLYGWDNSAFAPEPGGDLGGVVGPKDEALTKIVGVPRVSEDGLDYKVMKLDLDMYLAEPDPDDLLAVETNLMEDPRWAIVDGQWALTSNEFSVPGYGNGWREDLLSPFIDLTGATGPVTLTFDQTYGMESGEWDGGNVWVRTAENSPWELVVPDGGYDFDDLAAWGYNDPYVTDAIPGFAGEVTVPVTVTFDLSAYVGGQVQIRWAFASDGAYSAEDGDAAETLGWFIDNIDVSDAGGSLYANAGVEDGMVAVPGLPWRVQAIYSEYGADLVASSLDLTAVFDNLKGDSLGIRFRAIYDDNDEGTSPDPNWGFEIYNADLTVYTMFAYDIGVSFVDFDSTFTKGEGIAVGQTYDPQVVVSNFGLFPYTIYNTWVKIVNSFGDVEYERYIYTYAPGQGDTLKAFPDFQEFNNSQAFYNFPDWTPQNEGDYQLIAYTDIFGGDEEFRNDSLVVNFHAFSNKPALVENFNDMTDADLAAEWTVTGDQWHIGDIFDMGDVEATILAWPAANAGTSMLTSPIMDCSNSTNTYLMVEHWWRDASNDPDTWGAIMVTNDGGANWDTLKVMTFDTPSSARYGYFYYDISETADNQANVQVAFLSSYGAGAATFYTVDDFAVYSDPDRTPPAGPANFTATPGDMTVTFNWDAVDGALYYTLLGAEVADLDSVLTEGQISETTLTATGLPNGVTLYAWITATDYNGNESDPVGPISFVCADTDAPVAITDLKAHEMPLGIKMLTWTTPEETLPLEGSFYEIRYAYVPITAENWADARVLPFAKPMMAAGEPDTLIAPVEQPSEDTWWAIKATDEAGNISAMSNVALADDVAPSAINDLAVDSVRQNSVILSWTAGGDDGVGGGAAAYYELRVSYGEQMTWENAAVIPGVPNPGQPGAAMVFEATEFVYPEYSKMAFQMVVYDNNGNPSEKSNIVISDLWNDGNVSVANDQNSLPTDFGLAQNYPNPFNPTTSISYQLPKAGYVKLDVFNANGQMIRTLVEGTVSAGYHNITWDAADQNGQKVSSGMYFYRITIDNFTNTKKMILMK